MTCDQRLGAVILLLLCAWLVWKAYRAVCAHFAAKVAEHAAHIGLTPEEQLCFFTRLVDALKAGQIEIVSTKLDLVRRGQHTARITFSYAGTQTECGIGFFESGMYPAYFSMNTSDYRFLFWVYCMGKNEQKKCVEFMRLLFAKMLGDRTIYDIIVESKCGMVPVYAPTPSPEMRASAIFKATGCCAQEQK